jgi:molybdenum cofactor guanylyltransferase
VTRGAIVLSGGRSTRMGRDKASLPFGGEPMLRRVVRLLEPLVEETVVVARRDQPLPSLPAAVTVVHDEVEDQGPLGGLGPGLGAATADALYVTGCDVPFLQPAVVTLLFERLGGHDVAVARAGGYTHPLAAVYRRTVREPLAQLFFLGRRRPIDLFAVVDTTYVEEEALRAVDPELMTLANLNTPEAYEDALARLGGSAS